MKNNFPEQRTSLPRGEGMAAARFGRLNSVVADPAVGRFSKVRASLLLAVSLLCTYAKPLIAAEAVNVKSPDGKVSIVVQAGERLSYSAKFRSEEHTSELQS